MLDERAKRRNTEDLLIAYTACDSMTDLGYFLDPVLGRPKRQETSISFSYLAELAKRHRVSTLVHRAMKFYTPASADEEEAIKELRIACLTTDATNSYYKKDLMAVLSAFDKNSVRVIPIKGIILSERLHGDMVSRDQSVDMDLLVREEDVARSREILEAVGYTYGRSDEIEKYQWSCSFTRPKSQTIDLHWDITMMVRSRERAEALWRSARVVAREGIKYHELAPEELLLCLSAHLVSSGAFKQLRHICDIDRLLRKYSGEIDWDALVRKAKETRLSGSLYTSLKLVKALYGAQFPNKLFSELKVSLPRRLLIHTFSGKKVVLSQCGRRKILDIFLSYIFFEFVEARSFKDHLNIARRVIFPSNRSAENIGYGRRFFKGIVKLAKQLVS